MIQKDLTEQHTHLTESPLVVFMSNFQNTVTGVGADFGIAAIQEEPQPQLVSEFSIQNFHRAQWAQNVHK